MMIIWILAVLLIILLAAGFVLLDYSCGRKHRETDYWDPIQLEEHGYGKLKASVLAGRDWFLAQDREELECISYDFKRLHGIFLPKENAVGTILLFHGWHSSYKLDFMSSIEFYHSMGLNLLICEQRAHGESEGRFLSYGVKESRDVDSWVTYMSQLLGEEHPLYIAGISMGASTVLMAADTEFCANVRGIIADCGFTSPYDIIGCVIRQRGRFLPQKLILWYLNIFTRLFAGFGLKEKTTTEALSNARYPVLIIHGTSDDFVPHYMSEKAYEACCSEKKLVLFPGAGHGLSYIVDGEKYKSEVSNFVLSHLKEN